MKKDKNKEQTGQFKRSPFKALKGFAPKQASAGAPVRKEKPSPAVEEDESALFLRAVGGAKRLGPAAFSKDRAEKSAAPAPPTPAENNDQELFLKAMSKIGTAAFRDELPEAEEDGDQRRSQSSRTRQLKRGTIRITDELDLHGQFRDEALASLERFIANSYTQGQQAVLVITGKGINSPEGPVLQGAVSEWLRGKGKGMVAEFVPAPRDKGGSGAFVVFLRSAAVKQS